MLVVILFGGFEVRGRRNRPPARRSKNAQADGVAAASHVRDEFRQYRRLDVPRGNAWAEELARQLGATLMPSAVPSSTSQC